MRKKLTPVNCSYYTRALSTWWFILVLSPDLNGAKITIILFRLFPLSVSLMSVTISRINTKVYERVDKFATIITKKLLLFSWISLTIWAIEWNLT